MKVLFVDDSKQRFKKFKGELTFFPKIFFASTSFQAIDFLKTESPFDVILLDHDLDDEQDQFTENGQAVAQWIRDNREVVGDPPIIIHSFNSPCARKMAEIMDDGVTRAPMVVSFDPKILAHILLALRT